MLIEDTIEDNISTAEDPKMVLFAASLTDEEKSEFHKFFIERRIKFSWSYANMTGLNPKLVLYHLPLLPNAKPVKQKLCKMHPQVALLIKAKLKKLLDVGFIRSIDYAEWISNLVLVTKPNGTIRPCTDYRNLNKACPKDDFPLPNIDIIVELIAGHEILSLMDGFSSYNQIRIAPED
jgi:hypothetical protein